MRACRLANLAMPAGAIDAPDGRAVWWCVSRDIEIHLFVASGWSFDFESKVSRATVWKGASSSFHFTLAFSTQKSVSRCFPSRSICPRRGARHRV